jgi:TetR/AcrR family transcriptional regulator
MMPKRTSSRRAHGRAAGRKPARAAILAAAESEFARHGLAGARTDAIAAAAGVNHALLYYYFKSKEHLYRAVLEDHFAGFNDRALEVLAGPGPAREVLLNYVSLHFDFISARHRHAPLFQQCMTAGGAMTDRLVRKYFTPRSRAFVKLLRRGMGDGEFRKADPLHTAISIVALIVFYFSAAPVIQKLGPAGPYAEASLKRRKQEVLDLIRHGVLTDPSPLP